MKRVVVAAIVLSCLSAQRLASAEPEPPIEEGVKKPVEPPRVGGPSPGESVEQFCEKRLPALEEAYERAPDARLLYNLGRCLEETGDLVRAATMLERYLDESGPAIEETRRMEVQRALAKLQTRLARITVTSDVAGVEVRLDGACAVDATTYEAICTSQDRSRVVLANPGERTLLVKHVGFRDVNHVMRLNAGENVRVRVNTSTASLATEANPFRETMWTAWAVTGGAFLGASIVGVRAAILSEGLESNAGIATMVLSAGTLVAAGVATYFTVRTMRWKPRGADVALGLGTVGLRF